MASPSSNILIHNIYYMLSYAFKVLNEGSYERISGENFDNAYDLFASILAKGISKQLKQGLYREYINQSETLATIRGKLDINGTILNRVRNSKLIACKYDELSENNLLNQILKATIMILLKSGAVKDERKAELKKVIIFFADVDDILTDTIQWQRIRYGKENALYRMLINICFFVLSNLVINESTGNYEFRKFGGEQLSALYEKFILEYYKQTYPALNVGLDMRDLHIDPSASDDGVVAFLPKYKTDILLHNPVTNKLLIIDAKFYSYILTTYRDAHKLRNSHLNQIMVYVWNHEADNKYSDVEGMLLYAKTENENIETGKVTILNRRYYIETLDLNVEFRKLRIQLDKIAEMILSD